MGDTIPRTARYFPQASARVAVNLRQGSQGAVEFSERIDLQVLPQRLLIAGTAFPPVPELGPDVRWFAI